MKINMKRQGILFINYYEKQEDQLVKTDEKMIKINRKDFEKSLNEDSKKGVNHKIEYISKKPEKIQLGIIYVLNTPKRHPDLLYTFQLN